MPNHCENTLTITGSNVEEFIKAVTVLDEDGKEQIEILATQYPCPEELQEAHSTIDADPNTEPELYHLQQERIEKYGHKDWYHWCIENWGTKWGDYDNELLDDETIWFMSAWSPPIPGLEIVSQKWPELIFLLEYLEPGMAFCGSWSLQNGKTGIDVHQDIPLLSCPACHRNDSLYASGYHDLILEFECMECNESFEISLEKANEV